MPKLDFKQASVSKSIYRNDYHKHPLDGIKSKTVPFPCNQINYKVPMEMSTTNKADYNKPACLRGVKEPNISNRCKKNGPDDGIGHLKAPFPGNSSYNVFFFK